MCYVIMTSFLARNAADLIAYAHSHTDEHGSIPKEVRQELRRNIQQWLGIKIT